MTNPISPSPSSRSANGWVRRLFSQSEAPPDALLESLTQIDAQPMELPATIADADPIVAFRDMLISRSELDRQVIEVQRSNEERRREILRSMLDVADSLDRMIRFAHSQNELKTPTAEKLIEGLESTKRITQRNLSKAGVKRLETMGTVPDTEFCEIHSERDVDGAHPGTVVEELLPGYTIDGKLLRAASVIVATE